MSFTILRGDVCLYLYFDAELVVGYQKNSAKEVSRELLTPMKKEVVSALNNIYIVNIKVNITNIVLNI